MEFSYRISEEDYLKAFNPKFMGRTKSVVKTILFWIIILACLMVLVTWPQHSPQRAPAVRPPAVHSVSSGHNAWDYIEGFGQLLLAVVTLVLLPVLTPKLQRRRYRKDPGMQGQFTVNITLESISVQNSTGTFHRSGWEPYRVWYETKGVMVLFSRPAAHSMIVNLAGLSESQRDELRGILSEAIPKKLETRDAS